VLQPLDCYEHRDVRPLLDHDEPGGIRTLFGLMKRYVGNLPPMPGVFPDYPAPSFAMPAPNAI
jgi:hypothetical protein